MLFPSLPLFWLFALQSSHSAFRNSKSSDHLIRPRQHVGRNRQTDLLCRFEIDHESTLRRLLYKQISPLGAVWNFVHIVDGRTVLAVLRQELELLWRVFQYISS